MSISFKATIRSRLLIRRSPRPEQRQTILKIYQRRTGERARLSARPEKDMKKLTWFLEFAAIVLTALALMPGGTPLLAVSAGDKPAAGASVKIDNFSFGPADVNVPVGTMVTWTNNDDVPHVVASDDKLFKSKALDTDDHFSYTFTKPGTYVYYCSIHPKMTAKVVVH